MAHKCKGCMWSRQVSENKVYCRRVNCVKENRFRSVIGMLGQVQHGHQLSEAESAAIDVAADVLRTEGGCDAYGRNKGKIKKCMGLAETT